MSELWPSFLFLGYVGTLIFSFFKQKSLFGEELKFFGWYLVIGVMAAIWAHDRYLMNLYPPCEDCPPLDINLRGMIRQFWHNVVWPYIVTFGVLSLFRHLILLAIIGWRKKRLAATE